MKTKILVSLLLSMLFSFSVSAQQMYLIPNVGFNVSSYDFSETLSAGDNQRFSPGLTAGVGLNIAMNDLRTFILHPEINYSLRTSKIDRATNISNEPNISVGVLAQTITMHYLEVPLLARFDFGIGTKYYINAGPSFAYALSGREKQENENSQEGNYSRSANFDTRFNRTDWSAVIGGGIELPVNDSFVTIDARFAWGFKTLYKTREASITGPNGELNTVTVGPEGKNRLFTLGIGYALPIN